MIKSLPKHVLVRVLSFRISQPLKHLYDCSMPFKHIPSRAFLSFNPGLKPPIDRNSSDFFLKKSIMALLPDNTTTKFDYDSRQTVQYVIDQALKQFPSLVGSPFSLRDPTGRLLDPSIRLSDIAALDFSLTIAFAGGKILRLIGDNDDKSMLPSVPLHSLRNIIPSVMFNILC